MPEKIKAMLIFEIIGRPKEHIVDALTKILDSFGKEKGVTIKEKKINEPSEMKEQKDFYTTFAEIEAEFDEIFYLAMLIFKYMPAHVDVIHPEKISMENNSWNDMLNELIRRLHAYDKVARMLQMQKAQLDKEKNKEKN